MSDTQGYAPEWNQFRRWWMIIAVLLALLLLLLWFMGYGPGGAACKRAMMASGVCAETAATAPATVSAQAAAPVVEAAPAAVAAAAAVAAPSAPNAPAMVQPPAAARIYFVKGQSVLPADAGERVKEVLSYLSAVPTGKALVSGFHDPSGNKERNEALAFERAKAVSDLLTSAGIAPDRVVMQKPTETTGDGPPKEARRVEACQPFLIGLSRAAWRGGTPDRHHRSGPAPTTPQTQSEKSQQALTCRLLIYLAPRPGL
ncbi:MAG: OmpA family protein [Marinagarivorans sp.]|nr:OmpA family protein [Marinagarivorans sp.]